LAVPSPVGVVVAKSRLSVPPPLPAIIIELDKDFFDAGNFMSLQI